MDIAEFHNLARYRDASEEAISLRLKAARAFVSESQVDFAKLVGLKKSTYSYQEVIGRPSKEVLDYLYLVHEIGPNFILYGDGRRLPMDTIEAIAEALSSAD